MNKLSVYTLEKNILAGLKQNIIITGVGSTTTPTTDTKSYSKLAVLINSNVFRLQAINKTNEVYEMCNPTNR
jgi:hypothetical protein